MMLDAFFAATLPKWYLVGPFLWLAGAPRGVGPHFPESLARPLRGWEFWEARGFKQPPSFPPQAAQDAGICNPGTPGGASSLLPFPLPARKGPSSRSDALSPLGGPRLAVPIGFRVALHSGQESASGPSSAGGGGPKEAFPLRRTSGFLCPRGRSRAPSPPPQVGPPPPPGGEGRARNLPLDSSQRPLAAFASRPRRRRPLKPPPPPTPLCVCVCVAGG